MEHWQNPTPTTARNATIGAALLAIAVILMALFLLLGGNAGATGTYPTTTHPPTTTTPTTTIATTTTAATTTLATTTTEPAETTTTGLACGLCAGGFQPPPTTAATTTQAPTTTVAATTTVAPTTGPPDTSAIDQQPSTVETLPAPAGELPRTGSSLWLVVFGVCLVALGGLAVAWKRS